MPELGCRSLSLLPSVPGIPRSGEMTHLLRFWLVSTHFQAEIQPNQPLALISNAGSTMHIVAIRAANGGQTGQSHVFIVCPHAQGTNPFFWGRHLGLDTVLNSDAARVSAPMSPTSLSNGGGFGRGCLASGASRSCAFGLRPLAASLYFGARPISSRRKRISVRRVLATSRQSDCSCAARMAYKKFLLVPAACCLRRA